MSTHMNIPRLLVVALFAACGGPDGGAGPGRASAPLEPTQRDSAGIALLEHAGDALERVPLLALDSAPLARFASVLDDPDRDVSSIVALKLTSAGDVVGFERRDRQLVVLRAADGTMARHGRAGAGPAEFGSVSGLYVLPGDSLLMVDSPNGRFAVAHPDSGIVRTISRSGVEGLGRTGLVGRVGDSLYLLSEFGELLDPPTSGRRNIMRRLDTWRVGDSAIRVIDSVPGGWMHVTVQQGGGPGTMTAAAYTLPLSVATQIAAWADGFVIVRDGRWSLEHRAPDGRIDRIIQVNAPMVPVDEAILERYIDAAVAEQLANMREPPASPNLDSMRAVIRDRGHVDSVPALARVAVTPGGTVWVLDYRFPGDSGWAATAVSRDGRLLGRIVAAAGDPPVAWGDDRLVFRSEDALGLATIHVQRLHLP